MEWPWSDPRCILCLKDSEQLSRAHLFPEFLGGFLWSRTHCRSCNSLLGTEVEAKAKTDDSFRMAIEHALSAELPSLSRSFAEGQSYFNRNEHGVIVRSKVKNGDFQIQTTQDEDGSRIQDQKQAREGIKKELERAGHSSQDIDQALARFDEAAPGVLTEVVPGLSVRHGSVERWDLPFDGEPVGESFPAAIAFHFLALRIGRAIYSDIYDNYRQAILTTKTSELMLVERGLTRGGYAPSFIVGTEQRDPHLVFRVQMFGEFIWRVHWPLMKCGTARLPLDGIGFDIQAKGVSHLPPREPKLIPLPGS